MANPAHAFALSGANLISFHPASPTVANTIAITNLAAGETAAAEAGHEGGDDNRRRVNVGA